MNSENYWLLVEDDEVDVMLFKFAWGKVNPHIPLKICGNGEDAIQFLQKTEKYPTLIVSDINMPKITGYELLLEIQEDKILAQKKIPFMVLTTSQNPDDKERFASEGIHDYFIKPFRNTGWEDIIKKMDGLILGQA